MEKRTFLYESKGEKKTRELLIAEKTDTHIKGFDLSIMPEDERKLWEDWHEKLIIDNKFPGSPSIKMDAEAAKEFEKLYETQLDISGGLSYYRCFLLNKILED